MRMLAIVAMLGMLVVGPALARVSEKVPSVDPFPGNRDSIYTYDRGDIPDICFFPADKARWDGDKVMAADWFKLTDFQKTMFISEYVGELEKKYGKPIDLEGGWEYLGMMNQSIATVCKEDPEACAGARATVTFDAILLAKGMHQLMPPISESSSQPKNS